MSKNAYIRKNLKSTDSHNRYHKEWTYAERYFERLRQLKFSEMTVKAHRNGLGRYFSFLRVSGISELRNTDMDTFVQFRLSMIDDNFSSHSINLYLRIVKSFYAWLTEQSVLFINPAENLIVTRPERKLGMVLSPEMVKKLMAVPDISTPPGIRDRTLLEIAYATGARINELAGLTIYDIDLKQQTIKVMGKGSKERLLPVGRYGAEYLGRYINSARPKLLKGNVDCSSLWISNGTGTAITSDGLSQRFRNIGRKTGVKGFSCHVLRRSCATSMLRNGAHPEMVRRLLGHSSMKMLAQYLNITITDIYNTHAKSKPGR